MKGEKSFYFRDLEEQIVFYHKQFGVQRFGREELKNTFARKNQTTQKSNSGIFPLVS